MASQNPTLAGGPSTGVREVGWAGIEAMLVDVARCPDEGPQLGAEQQERGQRGQGRADRGPGQPALPDQRGGHAGEEQPGPRSIASGSPSYVGERASSSAASAVDAGAGDVGLAADDEVDAGERGVDLLGRSGPHETATNGNRNSSSTSPNPAGLSSRPSSVRWCI